MKTWIAAAALLWAGQAVAVPVDYTFSVNWTSGLLAGQSAAGSFTLDLRDSVEKHDGSLAILTNLQQTGWTLPRLYSGTQEITGGVGVSFCNQYTGISTNHCLIEWYPGEWISEIEVNFGTGLAREERFVIPAGSQHGSDGHTETSLGTAIMTPVPEPETYALMLAGLSVLGAFARRRKVSA